MNTDTGLPHTNNTLQNQGWLGGKSSIQPVKKLSDEVLAWLFVCSKMQWLAYGSADATATPSSLLQQNAD